MNKELLACVDLNCVPTGKYVIRDDFYTGKYPGANVCGIAYYPFLSTGDEVLLLLTERAQGKENKPGKISVPSQHWDYQTSDDECLAKIVHKLGINPVGLKTADFDFPLGVIQQPHPLQDCKMIVKNCGLLLYPQMKDLVKIHEDHVDKIFFWSLGKVEEEIMAGTIETFGTDPNELIVALNRFTETYC